jgi:hypothetical protein
VAKNPNRLLIRLRRIVGSNPTSGAFEGLNERNWAVQKFGGYSFGAERDHWIDLHRSPGWDVTREQGGAA